MISGLTIDGVIYFFKTIFAAILESLESYFTPIINNLTKLLVLDNIEGPAMNIIRKSS